MRHPGQAKASSQLSHPAGWHSQHRLILDTRVPDAAFVAPGSSSALVGAVGRCLFRDLLQAEFSALLSVAGRAVRTSEVLTACQTQMQERYGPSAPPRPIHLLRHSCSPKSRWAIPVTHALTRLAVDAAAAPERQGPNSGCQLAPRAACQRANHSRGPPRRITLLIEAEPSSNCFGGAALPSTFPASRAAQPAQRPCPGCSPGRWLSRLSRQAWR